MAKKKSGVPTLTKKAAKRPAKKTILTATVTDANAPEVKPSTPSAPFTREDEDAGKRAIVLQMQHDEDVIKAHAIVQHAKSLTDVPTPPASVQDFLHDCVNEALKATVGTVDDLIINTAGVIASKVKDAANAISTFVKHTF